MRCLALRFAIAKKRVFVDLELLHEPGEGVSGDDAAAATLRRHRRALVLVGEAVALADRQLFHRNLRRRRPFRAAAPRRPALRRAVNETARPAAAARRTTRCLYAKCSGGIATFYMIYQQRRSVGDARGGRAATPAPTYCGTTTARSARSTSRRGRRRAATTRRRTNWSCGTTSTTATLPRLLRRRRRGNFLSITSSRKALLAAVRH